MKENPRPQGVKTLSGEDDLYRIREGDYRTFYTIRDNELMAVIGDRKEIYSWISESSNLSSQIDD